MKLRRLEIEGFRGAPRAFPVTLRERTQLIFSENGRGKSTIADALELLGSGDLLDFHREGCGLDAAINLDAADEARIEVDLVDPAAHLRRRLTKAGASPLETDPEEVEVPPIPILRQSTITAFMQQTAGEKRQALLELLDLDALNGFRATLRKALGDAKERRKATVRSRDEERATLTALLEGVELLVRARDLITKAKLEATVSSESELDGLALRLPPGEPNREAPLTELTRALQGLPEDPAVGWNEAVADEGTRSAEALSALLEQGRRVLEEEWDADACPLCEVEQERDQLSAQVKTRAEALAESRSKVATLRGALEDGRRATSALARAIGQVIAVAPQGGWPQEDALEEAKTGLEAYVARLESAASDFSPAPAFPELGVDLAVLMPELHAAAAPKESPELAALQKLNELQSQRRRLATRSAAAEAAIAAEAALKRLLEIADGRIKAAVEEALGAIEELVERYFGMLMADPIYSDVKLVYAPRRSGQVEFEINLGPHAVNPPQRVMSESQRNALGLALLLARVKQSETPWRALVLDDVVNSFDSPHRGGLIRLLLTEFADWQLIMLSHDSLFRDIALREASGEWGFMEIKTWTREGGPVLGEGDPLNRLEAGLQQGETAAALGGYARRALEHNLSRAVAKLKYQIRFDPGGRYTAHDFLGALRSGLAEKGSPLAGSDVLGRIASGDYMATRTVHNRPDVPEASTHDLSRLVADLRDLDALLRCENCVKPIWFAETPNGHQCECSALKG